MAPSSASSTLFSNPSLKLNCQSLLPTNSQVSLSSKLSICRNLSLLAHPRLTLQHRDYNATARHSRLAVVSSLDPKPTVLVAEKLGEAGLNFLRSYANVDCSYNLSPEELCTKISLCDALIVRSGTKVTREVFESSGGRLKVVGRAGVGIDNVDLGAATEHGCLVVNAPTANTVAAAEHGIALLAAMARNISQADASVKAG
ncbi:hypothetical protein Nepgr_004687 [Nepenthes gracilis]|uniref:D-isomer specific 2-hydroxyacid dehydrogenase catalytic domain-containing protein n=1 Tax=Nepenthes gracilis TaxID=150966 RepID=A0AAD3XFH0_NEPGR|nr:hypothetical protein Nepgr_004687 [Nepenthes gracilis]